jgi:hypothetical protein
VVTAVFASAFECLGRRVMAFFLEHADLRAAFGKAIWTQMENVQVKVSSSADGWMVEAAIPLQQLGPGELRFNLTRSRQIKDQPNELSTWSPLAKVGNWHDPENYGTLMFTDN